MGEFSSTEFLFAFLLGTAGGTSVFFHAERNRIGHSSAWASFVFLFFLIGLPVYLFNVRRVRRARRAAGS